MSAENDKFRHSRRLHNDKRAVNRQVSIARAYGVPITEPHKYEKRHVLNCGDPKCIYCINPRKLGLVPIQEQRQNQDANWTDDDGENNDESI